MQKHRDTSGDGKTEGLMFETAASSRIYEPALIRANCSPFCSKAPPVQGFPKMKLPTIFDALSHEIKARLKT
jgi:hypothetical protein